VALSPTRAADVVADGAAGGAGDWGTSRMPQIGQSPGLSDTYVGCIGQWSFGRAAGAADERGPFGRSALHTPLATSNAATPTVVTTIVVRVVIFFLPLP
jgi:hypothetical protein